MTFAEFSVSYDYTTGGALRRMLAAPWTRRAPRGSVTAARDLIAVLPWCDAMCGAVTPGEGDGHTSDIHVPEPDMRMSRLEVTIITRAGCVSECGVPRCSGGTPVVLGRQ